MLHNSLTNHPCMDPQKTLQRGTKKQTIKNFYMLLKKKTRFAKIKDPQNCPLTCCPTKQSWFQHVLIWHPQRKKSADKSKCSCKCRHGQNFLHCAAIRRTYIWFTTTSQQKINLQEVKEMTLKDVFQERAGYYLILHIFM